MVVYVAKRVAQMVLVFVVFLTILFGMLHAQPGDITLQFTQNPDIPPEAREILARQLGLDRPLPEQYVSYITNFFTGNLGVSFSQYPRPVLDILLERLPRTVLLFLSATILGYYMGFVAGKYLAWRRGKATEYGVTVVGVTLYTVFSPWFYLMMIWLFSFILGWFPAGRFITTAFWARAPFSANAVFHWMLLTTGAALLVAFAAAVAAQRLDHPRTRRRVRWAGVGAVLALYGLFWATTPMRPYAADIAHHTVLPVMSLALISFGGVMLIMRSSMLDTLREDYILTARAKGLPERVIRDRHAARNALLPLVTTLVLALAFVISGGIIAESVFSWPGLGQTLLNASVGGDIPLAIGALAFVGVLALIGHLIVDILYLYLDPRIRY